MARQEFQAQLDARKSGVLNMADLVRSRLDRALRALRGGRDGQDLVIQ
jgi:hypothetical protein